MKRDYYFNADIACRYGVDGAIMLHHLAYWVHRNEVHGENFHEGRYWTYNSAETFKQFFPFWSADQIRRVLRNLERDEAIIVGEFNRMATDRTKWYSVTPEVARVYAMSKQPDASGDSAKSTLANDKMQLAERHDHYQVKNSSKEPSNEHSYEGLPFQDHPEFRTTWDEYVAHRKALRKPITNLAQKKIGNILMKHCAGDVAKAISLIDKSIANGWTGIFPDKQESKPTYDIDGLKSWATQH